MLLRNRLRYFLYTAFLALGAIAYALSVHDKAPAFESTAPYFVDHALSESTTTWKTYTNRDFRITFDYPGTWQTVERIDYPANGDGRLLTVDIVPPQADLINDVKEGANNIITVFSKDGVLHPDSYLSTEDFYATIQTLFGELIRSPRSDFYLKFRDMNIGGFPNGNNFDIIMIGFYRKYDDMMIMSQNMCHPSQVKACLYTFYRVLESLDTL